LSGNRPARRWITWASAVPERWQMKGFKQWILPLALILGGAAAIAIAVTGGSGHGLAPGDLLLVLACSVLLSGCIVLLPALPAGLLPCLQGGVLAAVAFLLLAAAGLPAAPPLLLRVAAGVGILLFMLASLSSLLQRAGVDRPAAAWWVILATGLLASSTVWSGPLLDTLAPGRPVIDSIIASSPLSYLATLAEWDYLRGEWFYRHAPFGGLRYDYLSASTVSLACLGIGLAAQLASRLLTPGQQSKGGLNRSPTPSQP